MKCPICEHAILEYEKTVDDLSIYNCPSCSGHYLKYKDYNEWLKNNPDIAINDNNEEYIPEFDCKQAKLCPECHRILIKYNIDNKNDFALDYCRTCGSVWFDKNEYEFIKSKGLHNKIHQFFTADWQDKIKVDELKNTFIHQYIERFGENEYNKIKDIKIWIDSHSMKKELIAYLLDSDPYKI